MTNMNFKNMDAHKLDLVKDIKEGANQKKKEKRIIILPKRDEE